MKGSTFQRIFSSGGIVYRKGHPGIRIALICRQGGTIWCLPKGHIEKGESLREAALREVQEETGLTGQVEGKVGEITYWYASREEKAKFLKKVTFFLVKHTGGSTKDHDFEVDQVSWFSVEEALAKMSYPSERKLLKKGMGLLQRMGGQEEKERLRPPQNFRQSAHLIYRRLFSHFGPQHWWPGETPFEVAVGAILTQNTSWANASKAVSALKEKGLLTPKALHRLPALRLAHLIRSSGYFRQKTKRLKIFVKYLYGQYGGSMNRMRLRPWARLREELLALHGIGQETADSIGLYALGKPTFVVDAYTRRFLARHSFIPWDASYQDIQTLFMSHAPKSARLFNEYHALVVALGKHLCLTNPKCDLCPLRSVGRLRLEGTSAPKRVVAHPMAPAAKNISHDK